MQYPLIKSQPLFGIKGTQTGRFSGKEPNWSNIPRSVPVDNILSRQRRLIQEYPDIRSLFTIPATKPYYSYYYSTYGHSSYESMLLKAYDIKNVYVTAKPIEIQHTETFRVEIPAFFTPSQEQFCECEMKVLMSAGCQCGGL